VLDLESTKKQSFLQSEFAYSLQKLKALNSNIWILKLRKHANVPPNASLDSM